MNVFKKILIYILEIIIYSWLLVSFCNLFTQMPERIELNAINYTLSADDGISIQDLNQIHKNGISFEKKMKIDTNTGPLSVVVTNDKYEQFNEITLIRGSFFENFASEVGQNLIVISDKLSFDTFRTLNSLGCELELAGNCYTVCGVYKRNAILDDFFGDGTEIVYIPTNSGFDRQYGQNTAIQRIMLKAEKGMSQFEAKTLYHELLSATENVRNYVIKDYIHANRFVSQSGRVFLLLMGLAVVWSLAKIIIQLISFCMNQVSISRNNYVEDRTNQLRMRKQWIVSGVLILIMSLLIGLILHSISFDFYLPNSLIPTDSIIDFTHYKHLLIHTIQTHNANVCYNAPAYEKLFACEMFAKAVFFIASLILSIKMISLFKLITQQALKYIKSKNAMTEIVQ